MILCCGETLIDMLPAALPDGRMSYVPHAGGAAFNTALAIARLGGGAGILSAISTDMFGAVLERSLDLENIDASHAIRSGLPSTLAFVNLDARDPQFAFFDENSAARLLTPDELPRIGAGVKALHLAGVSLITEPSGSTFEHLAQTAGADRLVWFDPNIRPALVADRQAYRARLERMFALADVIKISTEDLLWLDPQLSAPDFAARRLAGRTSLVLVTDGAGDAAAFQTSGFLKLPVPSVAVADTVGAGDAFSGAFLFQLSQAGLLSREGVRTLPPQALARMLGFSVRAASLSTTRPGASPPTLQQLRAWEAGA